MIEILCISILLALLAFSGWLLWHSFREIGRLKDANEHSQVMAKQWMEQANAKRGERKNFLYCVDKMVDAMQADLGELPNIQDVEQLIVGMSPDQREKLSLSLGPTFAQGMADLTALELGAIQKLRELGLRWSLLVDKTKFAAIGTPIILKTTLDTIDRLKGISQESNVNLEGDPAWETIGRMAQATVAEHLLRDLRRAVEIDGSEMQGLFLPETTASKESDDEFQSGNSPVGEVLDEFDEKVSTRFSRNGST